MNREEKLGICKGLESLGYRVSRHGDNRALVRKYKTYSGWIYILLEEGGAIWKEQHGEISFRHWKKKRLPC